VPFPTSIGSFIFGISSILSKFQYSETFLPGAVVGLLSGFEYSSWIMLAILSL
jgi:hypothetical protein